MPSPHHSFWTAVRLALLGRKRWRPASSEGQLAERAAARFLKRAGYRVIGANVRTHAGEADLVCIAPDRSTIVIAEVKSRRRTPNQPARSAAMAPESAVDPDKRRRLQRVARHLARTNNWLGRKLRIDVLAVEIDQADRTSVKHIPDLAWL